jgi:hypothetical protein
MSRPASLLLFGLLCVACSEPTANLTKLTYGGVFAGADGTEAGNFSVQLVVENSAGSGTFIVNGDHKSFSSITYDPASGAVVATGAGFIFTGTADAATLNGDYASPNGGGLFTALRKTSTVSPVSYCGTHIGTHLGDPIAGAFAFVQGGGTRRGVFTSVMDDPFRGELTSSSTAGPVTLDTLSGDASLTVAAGGFTGSYAMDAGDTGQVAGSPCRNSVTSPIISIFDGVIGSFDGTELGSLAFNLSSTGLGSTGTYKVGGVAKAFLAVISGVNNQVAAFDNGFRIIASLDTATIEGKYAKTGSIAGRIAALNRGAQQNDLYCGTHSLGGAFAFVVRTDSKLFGLYTGGTPGSAFQGEVTGQPGDDLGQLETEAGAVTILPTPGNPGSFGGFWDHSGTGGSTGTLTGSTCP